MKNNKILIAIALAILLSIGFIFRFKGITNSHPFWVDEFSSAHQAQFVLQHGMNVFGSFDKPPLYFENRNITTHLIIASSFWLFGVHEWAARLPMVIIGTFIPLALFLLARSVFNTRTAVASALLATFSYFEIVWSRQARGYAIQQLLTVLTVFFYIRIFRKKKQTFADYICLGTLVLLGLTTHPLYVVLIGALIIFHLYDTKRWKLIFACLALGSGALILTKQSFFNNLWYYHSFLWREYGLITFLSISGLALSVALKHRWSLLFAIFIALHIGTISFLLSPYTSRYLNPVFPVLLMLTAFAITQLSDLSLKHLKNKNVIIKTLIPICIVLFIIGNGHKFAVKPKPYYSVNHDFREIALVDYHQVYELMKSKGEFEKGQTAIVETWLDRMHWYMGKDFMYAYELKWDQLRNINGLPTTSPYLVDNKGQKTTLRYKDIGFINGLSDLKKALQKYQKGFIFIDDSSLPKEVIDYAEKNFKKELYLDHYPLDDNPYSIWPATLYSWGFDASERKN